MSIKLKYTGGGFGGSIVALVEASGARSIADRIVAAYRLQTGTEGRRLVPE